MADADDPRVSGSGMVAEKVEDASGEKGGGSGESTENLLDGREPSFFNVVMGPRRAHRVNGVD